jgi:hypothetical protein
MRLIPIAVLAVGWLGAAVPVAAQESELIAVGETAPDFTLTGATRYGVLADPVRLSDLKGNTVVLTFFFRARTRG